MRVYVSEKTLKIPIHTLTHRSKSKATTAVGVYTVQQRRQASLATSPRDECSGEGARVCLQVTDSWTPAAAAEPTPRDLLS